MVFFFYCPKKSVPENQQNFNIFKPNILYLEEVPPKIVKRKMKSTKITSKKRSSSRKQIRKSKKLTTDKKTQVAKLKNKIPENSELKVEYDPLFTAEIEIKVETGEAEEQMTAAVAAAADVKFKIEDNDNADAAALHEAENFSADDADFGDADYEQEENETDYTDQDDDDDNEDDEPLIMLTNIKSGKHKKPRAPRKIQCRLACKQACTQKFNEKQRQRICDYFWSLSSKEQRFDYLRKHTKTLLSRRIIKNAQNRGPNCSYYLEDLTADAVPTNSTQGAIRVCRKYFENTLCINNHTLKMALQGVELEVDKKPYLLPIVVNVVKEKPQFLDPETGTLSSKKTKPHSTEDAESKKKSKRKPGEPEPEHFPRSIKCAIRCLFKCHEKFSEAERKQMCDVFWSMDYKRRKDFILSRIETADVQTQTAPAFRKTNMPNRSYHTRFFLRHGINGENKRVCKDFMCATLSIGHKFIANAIQFADKATGNYTGTDRRGKNSSLNKVREEDRRLILEHIRSYPTWLPPHKKGKTRYLHFNLSIRHMYAEYKQKCLLQAKHFASGDYFRKAFHDEFRLQFLSNPNQPKKTKGLVTINPTISHYTGEEPLGAWYHPNGEKLDLTRYRPDQSVDGCCATSQLAIDCASQSSSLEDSSVVTAITSQQPENLAFYAAQPLNYAASNLVNLVATPAFNAAATLYDTILPHSSNLFRN